MWLRNGWGCGVCQQPFTATDRPAVDHDHTTGILRGCLHTTCNRLEGELRSFASRVARGQTPEQWLIELGIHVSKGGQYSNAVRRMAVYSHKGVTVDAYLIGLANYLHYHQEPRTRMIHPSHRFPNEGGNKKKPNPRFRKKQFRRRR
ncbi:endonuclease VII [Vibrio phage K436]